MYSVDGLLTDKSLRLGIRESQRHALKWLADQTKEKLPAGEEEVQLVITESNQLFYNCEANGASTGIQMTSVGFHESIGWEKPELFWYRGS